MELGSARAAPAGCVSGPIGIRAVHCVDRDRAVGVGTYDFDSPASGVLWLIGSPERPSMARHRGRPERPAGFIEVCQEKI